jgi:hypothetical protein
VIIGSTIQHENEPDICNRVDRHETAVKIDGQLINPAVLNAALKYASFTFLFILLLKLLVALPVRIVGMVALFVWILFKSLVLLPLQLTYSIISQIIVYPLKMAGIGGFNRSCS